MKDYGELCRCAAVTGHRDLKWGLDETALEKTFESLAERGVKTFFSGLATGFDTVCLSVLFRLREKKEILIVGCAPFEKQSAHWSEKDKEVYEKVCARLDERVVIGEKYTPYCMHARNRFMVDRSGYLVAYLKRRSGGTFYTVNYAREKGREIIYI